MVANNGDDGDQKNTRSETTVYSSAEDDAEYYSSASDPDMPDSVDDPKMIVSSFINSLAQAMEK